MISGKVTKTGKLPKAKSFSDGVIRVIKILTFKLVANIKKDKLSGDPLKVKTGRLRRSINASFTNGGKTGRAGTNVNYGAVHELGLQVVIREHMRTMTHIFGKPVDPRLIKVSQHTRKFPERSFLRSALKEMEPEIIKSFNDMVAEVVRNG